MKKSLIDWMYQKAGKSKLGRVLLLTGALTTTVEASDLISQVMTCDYKDPVKDVSGLVVDTKQKKATMTVSGPKNPRRGESLDYEINFESDSPIDFSMIFVDYENAHGPVHMKWSDQKTQQLVRDAFDKSAPHINGSYSDIIETDIPDWVDNESTFFVRGKRHGHKYSLPVKFNGDGRMIIYGRLMTGIQIPSYTCTLDVALHKYEGDMFEGVANLNDYGWVITDEENTSYNFSDPSHTILAYYEMADQNVTNLFTEEFKQKNSGHDYEKAMKRRHGSGCFRMPIMETGDKKTIGDIDCIELYPFGSDEAAPVPEDLWERIESQGQFWILNNTITDREYMMYQKDGSYSHVDEDDIKFSELYVREGEYWVGKMGDWDVYRIHTMPSPDRFIHRNTPTLFYLTEENGVWKIDGMR